MLRTLATKLVRGEGRQTVLAVQGSSPVLANKGPHFVWPCTTPALEAAMLRQLRNARQSRAAPACSRSSRRSLLPTTAIFAMFDALDLSPADEVICPDYTWFATASPLVYLGLVPVFNRPRAGDLADG